jgi:ATP-dependent DNA helicase RecG
LIVTTNLIDAYEQLIEFINKHTLDKFYIIDDQSVSIRSKIARELVSNILVHRDYTSAYPAKIIIEQNRIVTENWSLPKNPGRIDPNSFTPYPKNPLLASFFIHIGRADILGSGVRNLYKFTKMYSDSEPELVDGDVFKTVVPFALFNYEMSDNLSDNSVMSDKMSDNLSDNSVVSDKMSDNEEISEPQPGLKNEGSPLDKAYHDILLAHLAENGEISATEAAILIGKNPKTSRRVLLQLVDDGILTVTGANKNRMYKKK